MNAGENETVQLLFTAWEFISYHIYSMCVAFWKDKGLKKTMAQNLRWPRLNSQYEDAYNLEFWKMKISWAQEYSSSYFWF